MKLKITCCFLIYAASAHSEDLTLNLSLLTRDLTMLKPSSGWQYPTISSWRAALYSVPNMYPADYPTESPLSFAEVSRALTEFSLVTKDMHASAEWMQDKKPSPAIYALDKDLFTPFVQKRIFNPGSEIAFWGDLHGSAQSLVASLKQLQTLGYINDDFTIAKDNFYMMFLGDYVDRGKYGIEVIYTLQRLKIANRQRVFMTRGNHEDDSINARYGFTIELAKKFPGKDAEFERIYRFYNLLPLAIYLGTQENNTINFVQCCHGGLEPGFDPNEILTKPAQYQLIESLFRASYLAGPKRLTSETTAARIQDYFKNHPSELENFVVKSPTSPHTIGFMWHDFNAHNPDDFVQFDAGRGWMYGKEITQDLLKWGNGTIKTADKLIFTKLRGLIRAHQHNSSTYPELWNTKGALPLWQGAVFTLFSGPANYLPDAPAAYIFNYDSFVILKTTRRYKNWTYTHWWREFATDKKTESKNTAWTSETISRTT